MRIRKTRAALTLTAILAFGGLAAAETIMSITYNGKGVAISFVATDDGFDTEYDIAPSQRAGWTPLLQRWKDAGTDVTIESGGDTDIERGDTITEN